MTPVQQATANLKDFISQRAEALSNECKQNFQPRTYATLWYRWDHETSGWDFNHLEVGHCQNTTPTPKHPNHQLTWKKGRWAKAYIQLNFGTIVKPLLVIC